MATAIPRNDAAFSVSEIARATGGRVRTLVAERARGIVTDSRAVERGNLFVALRGATFDAHAFLADVMQAGAAALLVKADAEAPAGVSVIEVEDTLRALGDLAAEHRRRFGGRVVAITGSAGKTTTKALVAAALDGAFGNVAATRGNLNNLIGAPMSVLAMTPEVRWAVLELGTSEPGEIARLGAIVSPDVAVITLVAAAHVDGLGSIDAVAVEKSSLLDTLRQGGAAVLNADDARLMATAGSRSVRRITFGEAADADVRLVSMKVDASLKTETVYVLDENVSVQVRLSLLGKAAALDAAAALAVVHAVSGDVERAACALERVEPLEGRMRPIVRGDTVWIDDAYNANPASMAIALDTCAEIARARNAPFCAVLGDMKELGSHAAQAHEEIGLRVATLEASAFVGCGAEMARAVTAARSGGVDAIHVDDATRVADVLRERLASNAVVLVKGSRSMRMERVIEAFAPDGQGAT